MAGALSAGSVYVAVSASIGEFARKMGQVVKSVEDTAKKVKEAAKGIADVGMIFAGAMAGAVAASAQSNYAIQTDLEKLKDYLTTMAADLGDAFGPMLRQLTETVGSVAGAFQRLSPEVKAAVAQFLVLGTGVGAGAAVLSKAAGLVEGLAKAAGLVLVPALKGASTAFSALGPAVVKGTIYFNNFMRTTYLGRDVIGGVVGGIKALGSAMTSAASSGPSLAGSLGKVALSMGAILLPALAVAAAIAAVALAAGAIYEAWSDASTGFKAKVLEIWEAIAGLGGKLGEAFGGWFETLRGALHKVLAAVLEGAAFVLRKIGALMAPLAKGLELDGLAGMYEEMGRLTGDQLLKDLSTGANFLADKAQQAGSALGAAAKSVGKDVATSVSYGAKGIARAWNDMGVPGWVAELQSRLGGVLGGEPAKKKKQLKDKEKEEAELAKEYAAFEKELADLQRKANDDAIEEGRKARAGEERAAASSWAQMAEEARALAEAAAERIRSAKDALAQKFASAFGDIAALADTFSTGLAAGGPAGALVAVLGDLLTRSTQFATLVETLNGLIGMVADWLGKLVEPFIPLVGAIATLVDAGLKALAPALESLTAFIAPLVPNILVLGELFQGLAPVIALVVQAMVLVLNPLQLFAGPAMRALFDVLRFVSTVILKVAKALGDAWNGIVGAVQSVFRSLADISIFGKKPLSFLDGWADGLNAAKVDTDAMARALQALTGMTYEAAQEKAKETAEVLRNRKEMEKATQALTNVPSAFKYALRAYEAQDAQGTHSSNATGMPPPAPPQGTPWSSGSASPWGGTGVSAPGQTPGGVGAGTTIINIQTTNLAEAADRFERVMDASRYKNTGSRGQPGRFAVE